MTYQNLPVEVSPQFTFEALHQRSGICYVSLGFLPHVEDGAIFACTQNILGADLSVAMFPMKKVTNQMQRPLTSLTLSPQSSKAYLRLRSLCNLDRGQPSSFH
jgi:hypothetical protein